MCLFACVCIYIYIYIYLSLCVCVCVRARARPRARARGWGGSVSKRVVSRTICALHGVRVWGLGVEACWYRGKAIFRGP